MRQTLPRSAGSFYFKWKKWITQLTVKWKKLNNVLTKYDYSVIISQILNFQGGMTMMKHTVSVMNTVYTAKLWADRQYDRTRLTLSYPNLV